MAIGAAVDNAQEDSGTLNKESWDKYNLLRLAVLVEHDTDGTHLSTGDVVLKALFDANTILVANLDNTPTTLTIAASRILGRASTGNIAALTGAQVATVISAADRALSNLASVAINTSLISDTDDTDDLGSAAKQWKDLYIDGTANIDALIADTADINGGTINDITELTIISTSETTAGNASWIDFRSTVTSGDLTGIRSRVYSNAASAGPNVRGGYLEAKMGAASKFAAMLEGALLHADYSPGSITISGDVRGFTAHISQGAGLNAANLFGGLINIQTRGDETIATDDVGLMIRNQAVGGDGRTMDAGIKITDLNMGDGTNGFTYGIDLNGVGIATADIRFSGGQVITSSASLLTMPAIALTDVTMSLGSDVDGDIYYRASNVLTRLAKGTAAQGLVMNAGATAPEWSTPAGGGIDNVVEDTTPQLGGELDCQAHTIGFTQQTATGDGTTTIDWKLGNKLYFTFGAANETFTFTQPTHECNLLLVLKQDGTGSRLATWPNTVMWPAGTAPTLTTGANTVDIVSFYWNGTNYHGSSLLNFSVPV